MGYQVANSQASQSSRPLLQPSARILNSWKEIASYLGRGVRTVQRYEEKLGLPVHRPAAKNRSAVVAFSDEIERWLRNTPNRNATPSTPMSENALLVIDLEEIQFKNDGLSELELARQALERAHVEYRTALKRYHALKHQVETTEILPGMGKQSVTVQKRIPREQHFTTIPR